MQTGQQHEPMRFANHSPSYHGGVLLHSGLQEALQDGPFSHGWSWGGRIHWAQRLRRGTGAALRLFREVASGGNQTLGVLRDGMVSSPVSSCKDLVEEPQLLDSSLQDLR